jgi:hypothetical protein
MEFYVKLVHAGELYLLALGTPPTFHQLQLLVAQITTEPVVLMSGSACITNDETLENAITNGCLVVDLKDSPSSIN